MPYGTLLHRITPPPLRPQCSSIENENLIFSLPAFLWQLVFPVLVYNIWCAYMLDMHASQLHVLDPCHYSQRLLIHKGIHAILHESLRACFESFFIGWNLPSIDQCTLEYPKLSHSEFAPYVHIYILHFVTWLSNVCLNGIFLRAFRDDSAIVMTYYAQYYNGVELEEPLEKVWTQFR